MGVGLLERGSAITTFDRRISVSRIKLLLGPPVSAVVSEVPPKVRKHAESILRFGGPVPAATWTAIRAALAQYPELHYAIQNLDARAVVPSWVRDDSRSRQIVEQEQDAAGLALSLGGLERHALEDWQPSDAPGPFLSGLDHLELREDQLLINDMQVFGTWDRTNVNGLIAEFTDWQGHRMTVMNVNRHPLESTLGVDFIYYSDLHRAYTLIQYKRMRWESRGSRGERQPVYRPAHDRNIAGQIDLMRALEKGVADAPIAGMMDYRLGGGPCFVKICHPSLDLGGSDLCKGMYMDLNLWDLDLAHLSVDEANPSITFDKKVRYLSNTEFISLVRDGWIGSRGMTSARIGRYIGNALRNQHSVTLAAAPPGVETE